MESLFFEEKFEPLQRAPTTDNKPTTSNFYEEVVDCHHHQAISTTAFRPATMPFAICDFGRTQNLAAADGPFTTNVNQHEFGENFDNQEVAVDENHHHHIEATLMPFYDGQEKFAEGGGHEALPPGGLGYSRQTHADESDIDQFFRRATTAKEDDKYHLVNPAADTTASPIGTLTNTAIEFEEAALPTGSSDEAGSKSGSFVANGGSSSGSYAANGGSSSTVTVTELSQGCEEEEDMEEDESSFYYGDELPL